MTNLKKAQQNRKIDDFIKEHESDEPSVKERFDRLLDHMAKPPKKPGKRSKARGASARGKSGD
jgi:hypothetical protein